MVEYDTKSLRESEAEANELIAYREEEKRKLQSDRDNLRLERDQIGNYLSELQNQSRDQLARMSSLYRSNKRLVARLSRIQHQMRAGAEGAPSL